MSNVRIFLCIYKFNSKYIPVPSFKFVQETHLVHWVVVWALTQENLDHLVVPAGGRDVEAGLTHLVRDLQEGGWSRKEETHHTNVTTERGQMEGCVFL